MTGSPDRPDKRARTDNTDSQPGTKSAKGDSPAKAGKSQAHSDSNGKEGEQKDQAWRSKPPYAAEEGSSEPFKAKYRGECFCGRVKFQASADPVSAKLCHCTTCQRLHGAPMQAAVIFHKHHILFAKDSLDHLHFFNTEKKEPVRQLPCKLTCGHCRSPIADEGRNMIMMFPSLFHFDRPAMPEAFQPACHIFYGQHIIDAKDGKPKWAGHKDDSERMPDD